MDDSERAIYEMRPDFFSRFTTPEGCESFPSQITVFCDACGKEDTGDYVVHTGMESEERLAVARAHLIEDAGWKCDGLDLCPSCKG